MNLYPSQSQVQPYVSLQICMDLIQSYQALQTILSSFLLDFLSHLAKYDAAIILGTTGYLGSLGLAVGTIQIYLLTAVVFSAHPFPFGRIPFPPGCIT